MAAEFGVRAEAGFVDPCRDFDHARAELEKWPEYVAIVARTGPTAWFSFLTRDEV